MNAVRLTLPADDLPDSLAKLRSAIEAAVPVGFDQHDDDKVRGSAHARAARPFADAPRTHRGEASGRGEDAAPVRPHLDLPARHARRRQPLHRAVPGRGATRLGDAALRLARHRQRAWAATSSRRRARTWSGITMHLPDRDLAYLSEGSALFDDYVEAVEWAQDYAAANRRQMMHWCCSALRRASAAVRVGGRGDQLPPQLRRAGEALRRERVRSPARVRSARARASSASSPAAWARSPTSCAAWATRSRSTPAPTARAGA